MYQINGEPEVLGKFELFASGRVAKLQKLARKSRHESGGQTLYGAAERCCVCAAEIAAKKLVSRR